MVVRETDRGTFCIEFGGGSLELNLIPMNTRVADHGKMRVGCARMHPDGVLDNSLADLVGITALQLNGCPPVPRILWDNREHQWMHQARDYQIRPPAGDLSDGASFVAHIRHVIAPVESEQDLVKLWSNFAEGLSTARRVAPGP